MVDCNQSFRASFSPGTGDDDYNQSPKCPLGDNEGLSREVILLPQKLIAKVSFSRPEPLNPVCGTSPQPME